MKPLRFNRKAVKNIEKAIKNPFGFNWREWEVFRIYFMVRRMIQRITSPTETIAPCRM